MDNYLMIGINDIAVFLSIEGQFSGSIAHVRSIDDPNFDQSTLGWCSDKNLDKLAALSAGLVILSEAARTQSIPERDGLTFLFVSNPRRAFAQVLEHFFAAKPQYGKIAASAFIDPSVNLYEQFVEIGQNVVIEAGCILGKWVSIGHNTVIKSGTIVEDYVSVGSNCTIGGIGFGYEQDEAGQYVAIPHIGIVHLSQHCEIGNNVAIDRAVMGSTRIGENVKIDNLVHIAHGVEIGKNSLVIAHAMVAGSVKIGENVWVAPSSSIRQKLTIEDNSMIGLGSVVIRDVSEGQTVVGVPARPLAKK